jgi:hypothetical protein
MPCSARLEVRLLVAAALSLPMFGLVACGEDPFETQWASNIDTVTLFSLQRPEIGLASGFDFPGRTPVVIENANAVGTWDVALNDDGATFSLVPSTALGVPARVGIATLPGIAFEDVTGAPSDTSVYVSDAPVPMEIGTTYAIRSRELSGFFGQRCVYYSKLQPISVDLVERTLEFFYEGSPACNDRNLVPTESN